MDPEETNGGRKIEVRQGDITKMQVDAVVNAANSSLLGGGGVDGAIHRAGGGEILDECMEIRRKQGGCKTGEAVITTAGKMPVKYVIHTVGPVWHGGGEGEEEKLRSCYRNVLRIALENGVKTIAFPCISTGVYRFPRKAAARIAVEEVTRFLLRDRKMEKVYFVCFDAQNYTIYTDLLPNNQH